MRPGIINIYKEKGYTSFDVVAKLRGILHIKKIGHTGTLDPQAEGVLPICIGKATKVCSILTDTDKTYEATLLLGKSTDTYDIYGTTIEEREVICTPEEVEAVTNSFVGTIDQIPPMYSAIKVGGKRLYELARRGEVVDRAARQVTIYNIEILSIDMPRVRLRVECSKGTYIRSLCKDIGDKLGCLGCMEELTRIRVGEFMIEDSYKLSDIERLIADNNIDEALMPIDKVFYSYPKCLVANTYTKMCINGAKIPIGKIVRTDSVNSGDYFSPGKMYRVYLSDDTFVGIYRCDNNKLIPEKIFYDNI